MKNEIYLVYFLLFVVTLNLKIEMEVLSMSKKNNKENKNNNNNKNNQNNNNNEKQNNNNCR